MVWVVRAGCDWQVSGIRPLPRWGGYVTKCLSQGAWGANDYELRKFNLADTVTLSRSVFRVIRSLDRMGTDATARTCEKDGLPMREQPAAQA